MRFFLVVKLLLCGEHGHATTAYHECLKLCTVVTHAWIADNVLIWLMLAWIYFTFIFIHSNCTRRILIFRVHWKGATPFGMTLPHHYHGTIDMILHLQFHRSRQMGMDLLIPPYINNPSCSFYCHPLFHLPHLCLDLIDAPIFVSQLIHRMKSLL